MSTRITTGMVSSRVLADLHRVNERLTRTQAKIASGREIERPSDDPFATSRAMALREGLDGLRQYQRNLDDARGWQDTAETALGRVTEVVQRARELLIQGASDTVDATARAAIAQEVDELAQALKDHANAGYNGQYVFAGLATDRPPYAPGADDAYRGAPGTVARQIGPGVSVGVNVDLAAVLGQGPAAGDGGLLHVLRDVAAHLRAQDSAALRGEDVARLDAQLDRLLDVRARNGARSARLDTALGRLGELEHASLAQLSATEDVDIARAMIDFSSQQAAYQAALRASASIVQASLMDFLR